MKYNKFLIIVGLFAVILGGSSCKKYLDSAFPNPNKPTQVDPDLVFPSMENIVARGIQFDSRFTNRYVQYFAHTTGSTTWDLMGYDAGSDNGGDQWRTHYYSFGQNMLNAIRDGRNSNRPAYAGAGWALFAWSWMVLTDNHGEVILKEAFHADQLTFKYDTQPEVYDYVKVLTDSALFYLNQAKAQPATSFATGDQFIYNGDIDKWIKFTYAVKAMVYHRYYLKSNYNPDSVMYFVDKSFASNADNMTIKIPASNPFTDGMNFYGPTRNNMGVYRQAEYTINLMNGSIITGAIDPRMKFLFKTSQDDLYHGVPIGRGETALAANQRPPTFWGEYAKTTAPAGGVDTGARHFFKNNSSFPVVTYSELQFIKAEAAFKKGDKNTAYTAYMNGINGSFDMLTTQFGPGYIPITAADKATYIANPSVNPGSGAALTNSQIMLQKYIALWPFGAEETWVDMRRYQYSPTVYTGFSYPLAANGSPNFFTDNAGKPAYRIRPRYNSEYLWNVEELTRIGAIAPDYHTKVPWFAQP
jgi:hypothetical protein